MARIAGINIPDKKRIEIALTYIYGVGKTRSNLILADLGIDKNIKVKDITEKQLNDIKNFLDKNYKIEGDLKRENLTNIKRLKEITSYRGNRHSRGLPARGQRTKTNSRTVRGNVRKTMGSGRAKAAQKT
jgi:small subunit ribosomal protein S13